jgi:fatty acid omega-hydroxylase
MSNSLTDNLFSRTFGLSAVILTALAIKYPDRAVFDEHREGISHNGGWPILGSLPHIISNAENLHEFLLNGFTKLDSLTTYVNNQNTFKIYIF